MWGAVDDVAGAATSCVQVLADCEPALRFHTRLGLFGDHRFRYLAPGPNRSGAGLVE